MEETQRDYKAHCLVFPFPSQQGHINPMLQFSKLLRHKGVKVTWVTTISAYNTTVQKSTGSSYISLETISDGFDEGFSETPILESYLESFCQVGSKTLSQLLEKLSSSENPVDCVVYDAMFPWSLDVAHKFGIVGASFFTQSCAVDNIYYHAHKGLLKLPLSDDQSEISLPGLSPLQPWDFPSMVYDGNSYPGVLDMVVAQFSNVEKADWLLCNSFSELEEEEVKWMAKILPLRTIGPTIPTHYLGKQIEDDKEYGVNLFKPHSDTCMKWLNEQPKGSVAYVSFGSAARLEAEQMEELAWGLRKSKSKFLWVVREAEAAKLPKGFVEETAEKGLVVSWCPQLEVLAHEAVGCFVTHCGWNSTLEALSLGVPMVGLPQWTDQSTNAKYVMDVWKIGLRPVADEKRVVRQEVVENCIREILEGERGKEMQSNAIKWKELARKAAGEGGSSSKNIDEFIENLAQQKKKRLLGEN